MADVERAARTLRFPMLVKPAHGFASFGIRKESRVMNVEDLKTQASITMKDDGRALIEEFIEGREFTCLAAEDPDDPTHIISFKPVEFLFPEGESFKHYNLKWVDYNKMSVAIVTNADYEKHLREYTVKVFQALKGNIGYIDNHAVHHWHGSKNHRAYGTRWQILRDNQFDPFTDIYRDWQGVWQLTGNKPKLRDDIRRYFLSRSEDNPTFSPGETSLV